MKIALSATGSNIGSMVDPRFGRAAWLLIVDTDTGELIEAIDNSQGRETAHGAGIAAAAMIADKGVKAVLTGRIGPKALPVLEKAGITMINDVSGSILEAIARYAGKTTEAVPLQPGITEENGGLAPGRCGCGKGLGKGMGGGQGQGRGQCRRQN